MEKGSTTFVLGVAHSGTTIVYRLLGRHPSLAWFSQFSQRGGTIPGRTRFPFWGRYNRWARELFGVPWKKRRGPGEYIVPRPMEANQIWEYLLPPREEGLSADPVFWESGEASGTLRDRAKRVVKRELEGWCRSRIVFKLPRLSRAVPVLEELFGEPRFIHLVRDGRAVACSIASKFRRRGLSRETALQQAARHWEAVTTFVERIGETLPPDRFRTLSLESFQRDSDGQVEELLEFLDLVPGEYPELPHVREDTNRKWRERCAENEISLLEQTLGSTLESFGYERSWC